MLIQALKGDDDEIMLEEKDDEDAVDMDLDVPNRPTAS